MSVRDMATQEFDAAGDGSSLTTRRPLSGDRAARVSRF
jgi:hypothetical protein